MRTNQTNAGGGHKLVSGHYHKPTGTSFGDFLFDLTGFKWQA